MKIGIRVVAAMAGLLWAMSANASFHTFRIEQFYTNADGSVQFVVLRESSGDNFEHVWAGQSLRATPAGGQQRSVQFPDNLPSSSTANRRVLVATPGFAALNVVAPDFTMPDGFLPVGGGTLNYAGVHQVTFGPMPTDGIQSLTAAGGVMNNLATNFAGATGSVVPGPLLVTAVEFYHQEFDHYFMSHGAEEIAKLDAGIEIKGWARTGQSFQVYAAAGAGTSPVCRFYIPPESGNSHFYGRGTVECNDTKTKFPTFNNEDEQYFHVILPTLGECPAGTIPVYRVFTGRRDPNRTDANHRYMIDRAIRDMMVNDRKWEPEGDGPDLVVMCVPPVPAAVQAPTQPEPAEPTRPPIYTYP